MFGNIISMSDQTIIIENTKAIIQETKNNLSLKNLLKSAFNNLVMCVTSN